MRLSQGMFGALPASVARPQYNRGAQRSGIVHLGIGAFHRAHQAVYTDDAMNAGDRNWSIVGVSLRSPEVRDQLAPQQGLYSVVQRDAQGSVPRIIGAVQRVIVAPEQPTAVIEALASADTQIVSLTVTEKGYGLRPDGALDLAAADIAHDLSAQAPPRTLYGFIARALSLRMQAGRAGLSLLSCDNLADNGARLQRALVAFLDQIDPALARWFGEHCSCPSTMVDRIVPATTNADRDALVEQFGYRDEAAVVTEPFRQWVIEDRFVTARPRWETGGAQLVVDVRAFETAKLRMLNGAHSALAYLGLMRGHEYVHQAIADAQIGPLVETLMREEAARSLDAMPGFDAGRYADALLQRFANPALQHRLAQIAMDGSQKIPQRWLRPLAVNRDKGHTSLATLQALAAWLLHVRGDTRKVEDPMAAQLQALWQSQGLTGTVDALFGRGGMFAQNWQASEPERRALVQAAERLQGINA